MKVVMRADTDFILCQKGMKPDKVPWTSLTPSHTQTRITYVGEILFKQCGLFSDDAAIKVL